MNRFGRAAVMLVLGGVLTRLLWSGGFGLFVQQRMRIPLLLATGALLIFGLYEALASEREERLDPASSKRSVGPSVGWLLVLPILVLIAVEPAGLGAAAADRVEAFTPTDNTVTFPELETSDEPVELRVFEFLDRALWDPDRSLEGVTVRLEGLVVNKPEVDGFLLTRFLVSCCAADGIPIQIAIVGDGLNYENDTWVSADVVWIPPDVPYQDTPPPWTVEAEAVSIAVIPDPPNDPYESPF